VDFAGYKNWRSSTLPSGASASTSKTPYQGEESSQESSLASAISNSKVVSSTSVPITDGDENRPSFTYADIVDMIKNNKTIEGIKDIPDTVLEGQGTQSTKSTRRKPWEKNAPPAEEQSTTAGTEQVSA
jgi:hypothetical protein